MTGQEARDDEREAWTPSTEQVPSHYVFNQSDRWDRERGEAFDRWLAEHDAALLARKHPEPEYEYGAGYEAYNGREMPWFSMGGAAFTIREAAENEVARYDDPQVRLIRRTRPGPWVPVGEGETP